MPKEFPVRNGMKLVRHDKLQEIVCSACGKKKKSKLVAETKDGRICNGCYGQRLGDA